LIYEPDNIGAAAMYSSAEILCVVGSSGSWAIWGERPINIAIVRTVGSDVSWRNDSKWFLEPEDAIHALIEPEFNRQPLSAEWRQTFLRNALPLGVSKE
jgi:hypothetical protein